MKGWFHKLALGWARAGKADAGQADGEEFLASRLAQDMGRLELKRSRCFGVDWVGSWEFCLETRKALPGSGKTPLYISEARDIRTQWHKVERFAQIGQSPCNESTLRLMQAGGCQARFCWGSPERMRLAFDFMVKSAAFDPAFSSSMAGLVGQGGRLLPGNVQLCLHVCAQEGLAWICACSLRQIGGDIVFAAAGKALEKAGFSGEETAFAGIPGEFGFGQRSDAYYCCPEFLEKFGGRACLAAFASCLDKPALLEKLSAGGAPARPALDLLMARLAQEEAEGLLGAAHAAPARAKKGL